MTASQSRLVAALTVAAGAAVLFAPRALAVAGGLLLGFVLPGTALLGLFRRRALTAVERTVLTPALSMGVIIAAGLVVHVAGLRIDRLAWTVACAGVTLAAVVAARVLRGRAPVDGAPADGEQTVRLRQFLPLVLVAAMLGGAGWLSFHTSRAAHDTVVTALSATPSGPVDVAGTRAVRVSATGLLAAAGPYTIRVTGPAGSTVLQRTVAVTRDGTWTETLRLPGAQRMTVNLYRAGDATAHRTLFLSAVD